MLSHLISWMTICWYILKILCNCLYLDRLKSIIRIYQSVDSFHFSTTQTTTKRRLDQGSRWTFSTNFYTSGSHKLLQTSFWLFWYSHLSGEPQIPNISHTKLIGSCMHLICMNLRIYHLSFACLGYWFGRCCIIAGSGFTIQPNTLDAWYVLVVFLWSFFNI